MSARVRGWLVLLYVAFSMPVLFAFCIPFMIATWSGDFSIWLARVLWAPLALRIGGVKLDVTQRAPLPAGPAIYASNHESALDILALITCLPRNVRFVAKRELFRIPIFGWYLTVAGFIPVDRDNRARAVASLKHAGEIVRNGTSLIVFPEGTRSRDWRVHPFKKGPFVLAMEAGVPVVPIAIAGAGAITPKKRIEVHPGTLHLSIGEPIDPRRFPEKTALLREVHRRISEQHRAIGGLGADEAVPATAPPVDDRPPRSAGSLSPGGEGR